MRSLLRWRDHETTTQQCNALTRVYIMLLRFLFCFFLLQRNDFECLLRALPTGPIFLLRQRQQQQKGDVIPKMTMPMNKINELQTFNFISVSIFHLVVVLFSCVLRSRKRHTDEKQNKTRIRQAGWFMKAMMSVFISLISYSTEPDKRAETRKWEILSTIVNIRRCAEALSIIKYISLHFFFVFSLKRNTIDKRS